MSSQTMNYQQLSDDYQRIEKAIYYLDDNYLRQPELKEIAESIGLSEYHFQRIFTRWAGISPKRFLQFITKENAKELLKHSSVLDATYSVGLSSPSRLHDLFINTEAVTPGEYKTFGAGLLVRYGFHPTPFGEALIGITERGICHLSFVQTNHETALLNLKTNWSQAEILEDYPATGAFIAPIFSLGNNPTPISLFLTGTNFQLKVWEALLRIPKGSLTTYEKIAEQIGQPGALRAVGTAVGHNPIAYIIPCHRVIRKIGEFGNYRWGAIRKKALIGWETATSIMPANSG
ncbi:MAG: bifunctional helix-turn-helix domain-containing protein/methylated-DNA--[protein]-cysteine S-methyltransferase [Chloroflexi bacterium]|nr:bifunctional helix-turn-helix domain-containing protein/methylated-DNA--[protein]-cysteine S-methyltransferase [Chloroflexota bacterium]